MLSQSRLFKEENMSSYLLFSLILSSQFWCINLALNACRNLPNTKVSVIPTIPGETVKLRCYTVHNCVRWSWEIRTDAGTRKLMSGTCNDCSSSYEVVQNKTGVNILVIYNVSGWVTEEYTCSCVWKLQNSVLLTKSTEGCFQLITNNNFTTSNSLEYNFILNNINVQNFSTSHIVDNLPSENFTTRHATINKLTNKTFAHNVTSGNTTTYSLPINKSDGDTLKCQLKIEVNQRITVYTSPFSNTIYLAEVQVGDEVKVTCHRNASLEANCTNTEGSQQTFEEMSMVVRPWKYYLGEFALFNVTFNHRNCHFLCEEVDALSRQTCFVAVALLVNEQYLSSTSLLQTSQNLVTKTSQPGSIFGTITVSIPVTFLIIFAGLFGFFLLLITALVIYVIKVNCTMQTQPHVMLNEGQPLHNETSLPPNETTLRQTPPINYYDESVGLQRYIEMRPISLNEEAESADKEQPVYSDIPHSLKNTTVQKSSLITSNKGTIHFSRCLGNVDSYGCMEMTPTRTLGNSNSTFYQSPRVRNSMDPRLYSNVMYSARNVKGVSKVHHYSYAE